MDTLLRIAQLAAIVGGVRGLAWLLKKLARYLNQ